MPLKDSVESKKLVSRAIPFPKKLFSLTPKPNELPDVPTPAEA